MGPGRSPHQGFRMIRSKGLELGWSKLGVGLVRQKGQEVLGRGSGGTRWKTMHRWLLKGRRARIWSHLSGQGVMGSRVKSQIDGCPQQVGPNIMYLLDPLHVLFVNFFLWRELFFLQKNLNYLQTYLYIYSLNTNIPHTLLHWPVVAIIGFHIDVNITRLITQSVLLGKI